MVLGGNLPPHKPKEKKGSKALAGGVPRWRGKGKKVRGWRGGRPKLHRTGNWYKKVANILLGKKGKKRILERRCYPGRQMMKRVETKKHKRKDILNP